MYAAYVGVLDVYMIDFRRSPKSDQDVQLASPEQADNPEWIHLNLEDFAHRLEEKLLYRYGHPRQGNSGIIVERDPQIWPDGAVVEDL